MTAVVRFHFDNTVPIVVGDLLISSSRSANELPRLPTLDLRTHRIKGVATSYPEGVRQKLSIIGSNLAIGWAGKYDEAQSALEHLYHIDRNGDMSFEYLDNHLSSLGDNAPGFVGFLFDGNGYHQFGYRYERLDTSEVGQIGFLGTGSAHLQRVVGQVCCPSALEPFSPSALELMPSSDPSQVTATHKAVAAALAVSGVLLTEELSRGTDDLRSYGAGYEIIYAEQSGFRKLDDVTFALWTADIRQLKQVAVSKGPLHVCKYSYINDLLVIRSLATDPGQKPGSYRHSTDYVGPVYRSYTQDEVDTALASPLPSFNSKWLCNYFVVGGLQRPLVLSLVNCRSSTSPKYLQFDDFGGGTQIAVHQGFMQSVADHIHARYKLESAS